MLRYSAVVTATMASIGLTVAAGSYITNQIAGTQKSGNIFAAPATPGGPGAGSGTGGVSTDVAAVTETVSATTLFHSDTTNHGAPVTVSPAGPDEPVVVRDPVGGQLRVGDTYVGAHVLPVQLNSLTVTVDTNVFAAISALLLSGPLGAQLGLTADPSANTQLRTELDTRRGDVELTLTDPAIGDLGLQLARHPAPATARVDEEHTKVVPVDSAATVPEDSAVAAV
ncbi:hypothetical protein JK358_02130 [Nocardia sp. 2]|uniref:DUF2993 domain-containing protein n=1 Tax=Nocardia acididurans TaxID=2802282 RepID=A0ABS1LXT6_9NOCA|nr:hypothetical protein [Nocardia acididurans]MBL1073187.1 hypothetical protein [Nocardia acididurans]